MECLQKTIADEYKANQEDSLLEVEIIPGNLLKKYCEFSGSGDIYIEKSSGAF